MRNGLLQPAIATGVTGNLTSLQDTLSNLERICNTPLPFAYQAHLRMSLWYVLDVPDANIALISGTLGSTSSSCHSRSTPRPSGSRSQELHLHHSYYSASLRSGKRCKLLINLLAERNRNLWRCLVFSENPFNYDLNDLGTSADVVYGIFHLIFFRSRLLLPRHSTRVALDHCCKFIPFTPSEWS